MLSNIRPLQRNDLLKIAKRSASRQVDPLSKPPTREADDATRLVEEATRDMKKATRKKDPELRIRRYPASPINEVFRAARSSRSLDKARALRQAVPLEHDVQRSQSLWQRPLQRNPPRSGYSPPEPSHTAPLQQGQRTRLRQAALSAWASPPRPDRSDSLSSRVGHIERADRYCWSLMAPFRVVEQSLAVVIAQGNRIPWSEDIKAIVDMLRQDYLHFRLEREQIAHLVRNHMCKHVDRIMHRVNIQATLYVPVKVCIPLMNDTYKCLHDLQGSEVQKRFPQLFDPDKAQEALDTLTDIKDLLQSYGSWQLRREDPRAFAFQTLFNVDLMEGVTRARELVHNIQRVSVELRNRAIAQDLAAVREKLKTWQVQYTNLYFALQPVTSIRLETMDPEELDRRVAIGDRRLAEFNSRRQRRIARARRAESVEAASGHLTEGVDRLNDADNANNDHQFR